MMAESHQSMNVELWTLYSVGLCTTILRTYARYKSVRFQGFQADEFLVWGAVLLYTAQTALAYSIGDAAHGLSNSGMTEGHRMSLLPHYTEYQRRVTGSKLEVAEWSTYSVMLLLLKLAMLVFYIRLAAGLGARFRKLIVIGFVIVTFTFMLFLGALIFGCRPFHNYWQIYPDPGRNCQPAISRSIVWTSLVCNIISDTYIIVLPMPLLWASTLRLVQKIASTFVFAAGIFVLICAVLKSAFLLADPDNETEAAGQWGARESFTALVATNLPVIFSLFLPCLGPRMGGQFPELTAFKGGSGSGRSISQTRYPKRGSRAKPFSKTTFSESEEEIMKSSDMQAMEVLSGNGSGSGSSRGAQVSTHFQRE